MIFLWIFILNQYSVQCQYGVILSADNNNYGSYEGYLWSNNKIIFISPELKASVVKGVSKSEKICGFELRSNTNTNIPFTIYLLDELSGVGEMRVKPHSYIDYQSHVTYTMTIEAFDCDVLPHYSKGITARIYIVNEPGPGFYNESYTYFVKRNAEIGTIVGYVTAKSSKNYAIHYYLQQNDISPFQINDSGMIFTRKLLKNINQSNFQIRVVAKEKSKEIPKQSMILVTIEIESICQSKLIGIPDQLDYYINKGLTSMMETGQLFQQGHKLLLNLCHLPSPLHEIILKISLSSVNVTMDNSVRQICPTDIVAARIQRGICEANPNTFDLFLKERGLVKIYGNKSVRPEAIKTFGEKFTLSWWMKRHSKMKINLFCLHDDRRSLTISVENCNLLIDDQENKLNIEFSAMECFLNKWIYFTISQTWSHQYFLKIFAGGKLVETLGTKLNLFQFENSKFYIGQCPSSKSVDNSGLNHDNVKYYLEVGVVSLSVDTPQKEDSIKCLSVCGEAIIVSDSITEFSQISVERKMGSLYLKSTKIHQLLESLSKIHYVNFFFTHKMEEVKIFEPTDIWIDLFIECKSKEIIVVPRAVMRINFIGTQNDLASDSYDVEIVSNVTILASESRFIHIFPNFRFVYVKEESKDVKIESCTIGLLQRNLVENEKIYLSESWTSLLDQYKLNIKSNVFYWSIEGEADELIYATILRQVLIDMIDERKKISIICTLKGGDFTNQAIVEVIQVKKRDIHIFNETEQQIFDHQSINEKASFQEKRERNPSEILNMTKSKFIGVVFIAFVGGIALTLIVTAVTCFILKHKIYSKDQKKSTSKNNSKTHKSINSQSAIIVSNQRVLIDYGYDEDEISMADIPGDDNFDNISCETCNMTDIDVTINQPKSIREIPRSETISFPINHKKF